MKGLWFYVQNYKSHFCSASSEMTKYCPLENLSLCTYHFWSLPQFNKLSFTWEWTEPCWNSVHHLGRFVSWIASFFLLSHSLFFFLTLKVLLKMLVVLPLAKPHPPGEASANVYVSLPTSVTAASPLGLPFKENSAPSQ